MRTAHRVRRSDSLSISLRINGETKVRINLVSRFVMKNTTAAINGHRSPAVFGHTFCKMVYVGNAWGAFWRAQVHSKIQTSKKFLKLPIFLIFQWKIRKGKVYASGLKHGSTAFPLSFWGFTVRFWIFFRFRSAHFSENLRTAIS